MHIRQIASSEEAAECARLMSSSEPWTTLGRSYDQSLAVVTDPEAEVYVAVADDDAPTPIAGFIVILMRGAFVGYIKSVAVQPLYRSQGLGSRLIEFAERRILRDVPNVFICASSFNDRAKALYLRLGYEVVGELRDYIVQGQSEWLMRKTVGPLNASGSGD